MFNNGKDYNFKREWGGESILNLNKYVFGN